MIIKWALRFSCGVDQGKWLGLSLRRYKTIQMAQAFASRKESMRVRREYFPACEVVRVWCNAEGVPVSVWEESKQ